MSSTLDAPNSEEAFNIRVGYIKPETREIARNELRETDEIKSAAIQELRQLLADNDDLCYRNDDEFLLIFLRACHFYPSSALDKVRVLRPKYQWLLPLCKRICSKPFYVTVFRVILLRVQCLFSVTMFRMV